MDGKWLGKALAEAGKSQADLARHLGLAPPIINKMVKGSREIKSREADAIRAFLGEAQPSYAPAHTTVTGSEMRGAVNVGTLVYRDDLPKDLPILGTVSGGPGGFQMDNGTAIDRARRPHRLLGRTDVFGLYVEDISMIPAHRPGSLVICEKARPPAVGDDVVFELLPESPRDERRALLKRLVYLGADVLRVEQFNAPEILEFPRRRVANLCRVMTLAELLGV